MGTLNSSAEKRHVISILMENESGALSRVSGLFSARGYNIESLTVAPTEDPSLSRLTLVTRGSDEIIEQIIKQLHKLIEVVKLMDLDDYPHIEREMMLVKVDVQKNGACEMVKRLSDIFRARIIDVSDKTYTIEATGSRDKVSAFLAALNEMRIIEVVRSGSMGIARGSASMRM
ncbi:MAG: acetolactate synthase small subunit [Thiolinea sp.]